MDDALQSGGSARNHCEDGDNDCHREQHHLSGIQPEYQRPL